MNDEFSFRAWKKCKFRNPAGIERTTFPEPVSQSNHCVWYSNVKGLVIEQSCSHFRTRKETTESFRFKDNEYKIFSVLSSALAWTSVILAGKRDSRPHSTTNFSENALPRSQTSLSRAQRKAVRRQRTSPAVCTLPMVPCGSSPVARLYLAKNEAPEEEAGECRGGGNKLSNFRSLIALQPGKG